MGENFADEVNRLFAEAVGLMSKETRIKLREIFANPHKHSEKDFVDIPKKVQKEIQFHFAALEIYPIWLHHL